MVRKTIMKKRIAGLSGILVLPMIFAALVSACYSPDFEPEITGVRLDKTEHVLFYTPPHFDEHEFTATLLPNNVGWDRVQVEWRVHPEENAKAIVFFGPTNEPNARVVAMGNIPNTTIPTFVIVRVTVDGRTFEAACIVTVRRPE